MRDDSGPARELHAADGLGTVRADVLTSLHTLTVSYSPVLGQGLGKVKARATCGTGKGIASLGVATSLLLESLSRGAVCSR